MSTPGRRLHVSRVEGRANRRSDAERAVLVEQPKRSPAPGQVGRALGAPRALSSLGGKGNGRGAESVGPSHREQGNGQ
jgi:hypothetical protein